MIVYVDNEHKCHTVNDGTMQEVKDPFFADKCQAFVEGYCCDDSKGYRQIYPWKPPSELYAAQAQYELDIAEAAAAYQEGVDSAYDQ